MSSGVLFDVLPVAALKEFGDARLQEVVRALAHEPAETIVAGVIEAIDCFVAGAPQFDDITLLVMKAGGRKN